MSESDRVSTAREALLAELLGDVKDAIGRLDALRSELAKADAGTRATADALTTATKQYQTQIDDLVARLRVEMASIITRTTEHAARTLVSQQTQVLQQSATDAIRQALTTTAIRRTRRDWATLTLISAMAGGLISALVTAMLRSWGR